MGLSPPKCSHGLMPVRDGTKVIFVAENVLPRISSAKLRTERRNDRAPELAKLW